MNDKRQTNSCQHRFKNDYKCIACGQYNYKNEAIKTNKYATPFHFNFHHYVKSLRKTASKIIEPVEINQDTYQLLISICEKFLFTTETLALGLYIYQILHKLNPCEKFWSSAALIVAGKAVQLDKNVPYLNRYQRYAQKSFTQQEYQQAQRAIFEAMNFQVHHSTFITFLDFYLTCGVIFKEDRLNNTLVQFFEDDVCARAKDFIKKGTFNKYHPQILALGIIKEIRHKYNLQRWNGHLQQLTGYSEDDIANISCIEEPLKEISVNKRIKLGQLKGSSRNKFQNLVRHEKQPTIQKYTSISKSITLKENCYSTSKLLLPTNSRKQSQHLVLQSLNQDLTRRR